MKAGFSTDLGKTSPLGSTCPHNLELCGDCEAKPLSMCAGLPEDGFKELERIVTDVALPAQAPIVHEGDPALHMFNVTSGAVKVYKLLPDGRRQVIGFLLTGDFLGFSIRDAYAYSAEALTPVTLCRFSRRQLEGLLERYPQMERRLLSIASNELAAAQDLMLLLGRKTARERLASFLLTLSRRLIRLGADGTSFDLAMSRTDIADYLGLTTETVSRAFTQLRKDGLIDLDGAAHVTLLDPEELESIAEGE